MNKALLVVIALCIGFCGLSAAETPLSTAEFVARMRQSRGVDTYAKLNGEIQHRRQGGDAKTFPLYVGLIIQQQRSTGQLIIDKNEGYLIGQSRTESGNSILPMQPDTSKLDYVGLLASDLTLSFIFDPLLGEDEPEQLRGFIPCRVLRFRFGEPGGVVRVLVAEEQLFPLRAEFFRSGETQPYRTLEVVGFEQKNSLYYASKIRLEGPGWRTRINFDPDTAELGLYTPGQPVSVIRKINAE